MVEFAIVFPVMILIVLLIIQVSLLMVAKLIVNYAAFCSVRASIVGLEQDKIERAAQLVCIPISPKMTSERVQDFAEYEVLTYLLKTISSDAVSIDYRDKLDELKDKMPDFNPVTWLSGDLSSLSEDAGFLGGLFLINYLSKADNFEVLLKYPFSYMLTNVDVSDHPNGIDRTAKVTHHYALRIPVINKIMFYFSIKLRMFNSSIKFRKNLVEIMPKLNLYLIPICAEYTLPVEKTLGADPSCCN